DPASHRYPHHQDPPHKLQGIHRSPLAVPRLARARPPPGDLLLSGPGAILPDNNAAQLPDGSARSAAPHADPIAAGSSTLSVAQSTDDQIASPSCSTTTPHGRLPQSK